MIISGGISKERLISLDTGKQVAKELKKNGYKIKINEPNFSLLDTIRTFKPNIYLMLYMVSLEKMVISKQF